MPSINDKIGEKIRKYRKNANLTQESLALSAGINISFLGDIERDIKKPSIESLEKILTALNVRFVDFFAFEDDIKPYKACSALEKINIELTGRSDNEVELIYAVIKQILDYNETVR